MNLSKRHYAKVVEKLIEKVTEKVNPNNKSVIITIFLALMAFKEMDIISTVIGVFFMGYSEGNPIYIQYGPVIGMIVPSMLTVIIGLVALGVFIDVNNKNKLVSLLEEQVKSIFGTVLNVIVAYVLTTITLIMIAVVLSNLIYVFYFLFSGGVRLGP